MIPPIALPAMTVVALLDSTGEEVGVYILDVVILFSCFGTAAVAFGTAAVAFVHGVVVKTSEGHEPAFSSVYLIIYASLQYMMFP